MDHHINILYHRSLFSCCQCSLSWVFYTMATSLCSTCFTWLHLTKSSTGLYAVSPKMVRLSQYIISWFYSQHSSFLLSAPLYLLIAGLSLLMTFLFSLVIINIFAQINFAFYRELFDADGGTYCRSMYECFISVLHHGLIVGLYEVRITTFAVIKFWSQSDMFKLVPFIRYSVQWTISATESFVQGPLNFKQES